MEQLIESAGFEVVGIARTATEALSAYAKYRPNVVTVDIQLADGSSGIDAVNTMLADRRAAVVFVTAYPERLLTGKRPEPAHLITKPFNPNRLIETIRKSYEEFVGA